MTARGTDLYHLWTHVVGNQAGYPTPEQIEAVLDKTLAEIDAMSERMLDAHYIAELAVEKIQEFFASPVTRSHVGIMREILEDLHAIMFNLK